MDMKETLKKLREDRIVFITKDLKEYTDENIHSIKLSNYIKQHIQNNDKPRIEIITTSSDGSKVYCFKDYFNIQIPYFNEALDVVRFKKFMNANQDLFEKIIKEKFRDNDISLNDEFLLDIDDEGNLIAKIQKRVRL